MKKIIITILVVLSVTKCSSENKKDIQDSRWNENCPYTEDNCGYPFENYMYDEDSVNARKLQSSYSVKKIK